MSRKKIKRGRPKSPRSKNTKEFQQNYIIDGFTSKLKARYDYSVFEQALKDVEKYGLLDTKQKQSYFWAGAFTVIDEIAKEIFPKFVREYKLKFNMDNFTKRTLKIQQELQRIAKNEIGHTRPDTSRAMELVNELKEEFNELIRNKIPLQALKDARKGTVKISRNQAIKFVLIVKELEGLPTIKEVSSKMGKSENEVLDIFRAAKNMKMGIELANDVFVIRD